MNEKPMGRLIYADHAATTPLDKDAFEAMKPYLLVEYGNASQSYSFSRSAKKALRQARETIASCINASPDEIYFTSGGTESDNWAIKGTMLEYDTSRHLLTSAIEHHAVLNSCTYLEKHGYQICRLSPDSKGVIHPETLDACLSESTALVSVMFANNEIGTIQPIQELCRRAKKYNALFHTDAVQAVGHIPVDVKTLGVDMLSASAHKFNGPKGIGFLYVKNGVPLPPYLHGGAQEHGMRAGTENVAFIVGMAEALRLHCERMATETAKCRRLTDDLLEELSAQKIVFLSNGMDNRIPGNISLSFPYLDAEMLLHRLDLLGIIVSTGSACDSQNTQISHVLKAIRLASEYAEGTIRISFGAENHSEDGILIARSIAEIIKSKGAI